MLVILFLLTACQVLPKAPVPGILSKPATTQTLIEDQAKLLKGRVISLEGTPISGAEVSSAGRTTQSDKSGQFTLPSDGAAQWVTVSHQAYISRTRAAAPGKQVLFRLTPADENTVVLHFGGDTMFGRRFFDPNEDGDPTDGLLPVHPSLEDHLALIEPIRPLLSNADLTVVNMESPLSEEPYISPRDSRPKAYHSTKSYVFSSHPVAVQALKSAGVDVVGLGNNHIYDLLEEGLEKTMGTLDQAGVPYFGAGRDETSAWKPVLITIKGQTLAMIGCTTIFAPVPPVSDHDITYTASDAPGKGGAAFCEEEKLRGAIESVKAQGAVAIVMIHGGFEYNWKPSPNMANFSEIARQAGATLVINHHPHVVGGLTWDSSTLTAYSLGNFIFDQTIWPTFESYLLAVTLRNGQVLRVYAEPLIVEDFVAQGVTEEMANHVARGAAGRAPGVFLMENGAAEADLRGQAIEHTYVMPLSGEDAAGRLFAVPQSQWISNFQGTGHLRLGRDLLWIGSFENQIVGGQNTTPLLWETGETLEFGKDFAYQGQGGIRLTRGSSNQRDAVTTHTHRVLVQEGSELTLSGMVRASPGALVTVQISWFPELRGSSSQTLREGLKITQETAWQPFRLDMKVPSGMVGLGIYLRLSPPVSGTATADFDDLRLIEWAPEGESFSPLYDHALLTGSGELTLRQQVLPGAAFELYTPQP